MLALARLIFSLRRCRDPADVSGSRCARRVSRYVESSSSPLDVEICCLFHPLRRTRHGNSSPCVGCNRCVTYDVCKQDGRGEVNNFSLELLKNYTRYQVSSYYVLRLFAIPQCAPGRSVNVDHSQNKMINNKKSREQKQSKKETFLPTAQVVLRGAIVNRTYGTHKNQYIFLF